MRFCVFDEAARAEFQLMTTDGRRIKTKLKREREGFGHRQVWEDEQGVGQL